VFRSIKPLCLISGSSDAAGIPKLGLYCASSKVLNKRHFYRNKRKTVLSPKSCQLRFLDVRLEACSDGVKAGSSNLDVVLEYR